jgi:hypothetical protein
VASHSALTTDVLARRSDQLSIGNKLSKKALNAYNLKSAAYQVIGEQFFSLPVQTGQS